MTISTEELEALLEAHRQEIVDHLIVETKNQITYKLNYELSKQIGEIASEFVKKEVLPEIQATLTTDKSVIIQAIIKASEDISNDLCKALVDEARKRLSESYHRGNIFKAIWG